MGRIKIENLPEDTKISPDEMKRVRGGSFFGTVMFKSSIFYPRVGFGTSALLGAQAADITQDKYS